MDAGDKIRVLIVDDIAETRENIRKLLQFENDMEVVGVGRTGREAIELTKETKPDVVLMDINMPDMDGIVATEKIQRSVPSTQIVILSVQGDSNYMRRAMLAGARDFITKPPSVDDLTAAIRRAGKMAHDERAKHATPLRGMGVSSAASISLGNNYGRVISVYSPKGGTGCTTVAINLAMTLHSEETPVIIVDGSLQFGDVSVFLNEQSKNSIADLTPRADELDHEIVEEVVVTHSASGVSVLAAPSRPEYADEITGEQFTKVVQYLRRLYAYVIVDTSSTLTDVTLESVIASDLVLLLTSQAIPSIKNARLFLDLATVLEIDRRRILFVMNQFDKRIGITPQKIGESFKHDVVAVLPSEERIVIPSINRGRPFVLEDKSKTISKAILSLAEIIRQRISEISKMETEQAEIAGVNI
jgi:pilus assembly protein CpaE